MNSPDAAIGFKVMAVEARIQDLAIQDGKPQYGKTRLLQELAARAVRDGHIPCLVSRDETAPATPMDVGWHILDAIITTCERFGIQLREDEEGNLNYEYFKLKQQIEAPHTTVQLDPLTRQALQRYGVASNRNVVAAALRVDLLALVKDARKELCPEAKILLLLDEVHLFGIEPPGNAALDLLVKNLLTLDGLVRPGDPIRIVFTFSTFPQVSRREYIPKSTDQEYQPANKILIDFVQQARDYVKSLPLEAFKGPGEHHQSEYGQDEYRLAYQQFLLNRNLVVHDCAEPDKVDQLYGDMHEAIRGIPSLLRPPNRDLDWVILYNKRFSILKQANDDDILRQMIGPWRFSTFCGERRRMSVGTQ